MNPRLYTILDEAFGPYPVMDDEDEVLDELERKIYELLTTRESDLDALVVWLDSLTPCYSSTQTKTADDRALVAMWHSVVRSELCDAIKSRAWRK